MKGMTGSEADSMDWRVALRFSARVLERVPSSMTCSERAEDKRGGRC